MRQLAVVFGLLLGLWAMAPQAATKQVYDISIDLGGQFNSDTVSLEQAWLTGTIETDGTSGALTAGNILSWSFTYGIEGYAPQTIDSTGIAGTANLLGIGSALFASGNTLLATALTFGADVFSFQNGLASVRIAASVFGPSIVFIEARFEHGTFTDFNGRVSALVPQNLVIGTAVPVSEVPLPASLPLLIAGLGGLALLSRRRPQPARA